MRALALVLLAACSRPSPPTATTDTSASASASSAPASSASTTAKAMVTGMIDDAPFVAKDAFVVMSYPTDLGLVITDYDDACAKRGTKLTGSNISFQISQEADAGAAGTHHVPTRTDDVLASARFAQIDAGHVAKETNATAGEIRVVTLSRHDADGTFDLTFPNGCVHGTFHAHECPGGI